MNRFVLTFCLGVLLVSSAQAQIAVVAHPGVPATEISTNALLDIFTLDQNRWSDGSRIVPLNLESSADDFFGRLGRNHNDMKKVWLRKRLSGEGQPPESVESPTALIKRVASTPGAVGFVPASSVDSSVRVIATLK